MSDNLQQRISPFDAICQVDEDGNEHWSARDMAKLLGYSKWDKFKVAIERAMKACENSGEASSYHFPRLGKMVNIGSGARREKEDYHLTRYACYLIIQNADPSKPIVALGQTYFAVQTRRQELQDELSELPEDQKRLVYRAQMSILNTRLAEAAQQAGVIEPFDFAIFQDHGYRGLYGGETASMIAARKGLEPDQHILDFMGSDELIANAFRASQTRQKLERDQVQSKDVANQTHYQVGRKVRQTIEELGGTMPEDLPTPSESVQELERKERRRLKGGE